MNNRKNKDEILKKPGFFQAIFEQTPEAMLILDNDAFLIEANIVSLELFNLKHDDIASKTIFDIMPVSNIVNAYQDWESLAKSGFIDKTYIVKWQNNSKTEVEFKLIGNIIPGIHLAIINNFKAQNESDKKIRDIYQLYRLIFDNSEEGLLLETPEGRILDANPASTRILGYSKEELISLGRSGLIDTADADWTHFFNLREKEGFARAELTIKNKNGVRFPVEVNSKILSDSKGNSLSSFIFRDISERKKEEEELMRHREHLEAMVENRTKELEITNEMLNFEISKYKQAEEQLQKSTNALTELNVTKDKFIRIIVHNLRNPLASLISASEYLIQNAHRFGTERIVELASIFNKSAKNGSNVLENLLAWTRSQSGCMECKPINFNFHDLVTECFADISLSALNKNIELNNNIPLNLILYADRNMLNTIVRNLLNNAVKFTPDNGKITVLAEAKSQETTIVVKDSGIGINKDDLSKLFRIDTKYIGVGTVHEIGTGLGLILCREFIERHCGKIWVESEENKGSEFKFSIPSVKCDIT